MTSERPVPPQVQENLNRKYHLDDPLPKQYVDYLLGALQGDFGPSYRSRSQSVTDIITQFLPVSLQLGVAAMLLAVVVALPLGGLAAIRRGTWVDWLIVALTTTGISLPSYVVASVLVVVLGVKLGLVPTIGWDGLFSVQLDRADHRSGARSAGGPDPLFPGQHDRRDPSRLRADRACQGAVRSAPSSVATWRGTH